MEQESTTLDFSVDAEVKAPDTPAAVDFAKLTTEEQNALLTERLSDRLAELRTTVSSLRFEYKNIMGFQLNDSTLEKAADELVAYMRYAEAHFYDDDIDD